MNKVLQAHPEWRQLKKSLRQVLQKQFERLENLMVEDRWHPGSFPSTSSPTL